jgi:hypothetical protein
MNRKRILNDREWLLQTTWAAIEAQNKRKEIAQFNNMQYKLKKQKLKICMKACVLTIIAGSLAGIVLVWLVG